MQFILVIENGNEKRARRRRKHCALAVVKAERKIPPRRRPHPGGVGRPKFNQLETVIYLYLQTQFGEDRCTQFRIIVVTDPQTNKQTGASTIHCTAYFASAQCTYSSPITLSRQQEQLTRTTSD